MMDQPSHLLDTSALLAYYLKENGWEVVDRLIFDEASHLRVSSVVWLEFQTRLHALVEDASERAEVMDLYHALLGEGISADDAIAARAHELKEASAERRPNLDAIIAATAAMCNAILVHRDPHMAAIPLSVLPQLVLPNKVIRNDT